MGESDTEKPFLESDLRTMVEAKFQADLVQGYHRDRARLAKELLRTRERNRQLAKTVKSLESGLEDLVDRAYQVMREGLHG